ncbi:dihydroorotate dehydrogenase B, electron transfer subunit [Clostridium acetireducens DSM 10703]|jgi:dihydroorotate dehydrogenase electron transfer subunit|uniref:Dihydroorotate dehydrogenase B (NAD(+)), electron transfer subunit n=1 Tax=Clostridium acetireducens DSM 10703 TaxID=1121290 RepID=A0A1E8EZ70_9CLOT|nr:dihydroorotate dehydrogenase electron transfer subunit [Clostridium acetireducens]OFI06262.1 dihydroorotate dehydrogenase B, electron transfer subunit [Clostridium acetireducens DSM 10703]
MSLNKINYNTFKVFENKVFSNNIYKLTIKGNFQGIPGQFYMIRGWGKEPILSRPISINYINENEISFLYQVIGRGTKLLSKLKSEDEIQLLGPLGNGFDVENIKGNIAVISGGIGIAPMMYLIKQLKDCNIDLYSGFKDSVYGIEEVRENIKSLNIATDSGKVGHKGYITDIFKPELYDKVLCCGPEVMTKKVIRMCRDNKIPLSVSLENKMACGIGACLVCTCSTKLGNKKTCKDGPVFSGEDIIIE